MIVENAMLLLAVAFVGKVVLVGDVGGDEV